MCAGPVCRTPGGLPASASLCQVLLGHTTPKGTLPGGQVVLKSGKAGLIEGTGQETSALGAPGQLSRLGVCL